MEIHVAEGWRQAFPGASVGILAMDGVENPPESAALMEHVQRIEDDSRERYALGTRSGRFRTGRVRTDDAPCARSFR